MIKSKNLTGGQAAIKSLKKEKVKHVFGLIGSATMEMFDALYHQKKIKFIGVRDERTGTHMADGYARASNSPGVMLAGQNGPGATNLIASLYLELYLIPAPAIITILFEVLIICTALFIELDFALVEF